MSDDSFHHDQEQFDPVDVDGGVEVNELEAKYADLFAEVIWDGVITPEKRSQLRNASKIFGLSPVRARQIEESVGELYESRHQIAVVEDETTELVAEEPLVRKPPQSIAPLAPAKDPRLSALQGRISVLEEKCKLLAAERDKSLDHSRQLEQLVEQLQTALESTLEELDEVESKRGDDVQLATAPLDDDMPTSSVQPLSQAPPPPEAGTVEVTTEEVAVKGQQPEPPRSIARKRWRSRRILRDSVPPPPGDGSTAAATKDGDWSDTSNVQPAVGPSRGDPGEIHRLVRLQPRDTELLRALYATLQRSEDLDRRWRIAHTLVFLGDANEEERALCDRHTPSGLVRPKRAINEDEWHELLFHPDEDPLTGMILAEIAPAVLLGHIPAMRASIAPETLDPAQRVDPRKSTLQAARCFAWAAQALGVAVPPLYVTPDFPGTVELVMDPRPATRLGAQALVGREAKELAFIAGRHLSWYRKEHLLGKPTRSFRRLEDMFVAALMIGNPGLPMTPEIKKRVEPLARSLRPLLAEDAIQRLSGYFTSFVEQGGRTNLVKWLEAADRTAACTGMLLCNDLTSAHQMLTLEDEKKADSRMNELIVFFTAGRCSLLRKRIGIAIEPEA